MSKRETRWLGGYWEQVGGTLIEESCAVRGSQSCGVWRIDAVIIEGLSPIREQQSAVSVEGKDIIVVQAKGNLWLLIFPSRSANGIEKTAKPAPTAGFAVSGASPQLRASPPLLLC